MRHIISAAEEGLALRSILRGGMRLSYTAVKSAKWAGRIRLNGLPATVDTRVKAGDLVEFLEADSAAGDLPLPCGRPVTVVWEDEHLAVVCKDAPLPTQRGRGSDSVTLENCWFTRCGCPDDFLFRPVNRLDKGTSGLMVIAKSAHAQDRLQRLLHTEDFVREYLAVTEGIPDAPAGRIDLPIAKEDAASVRRVISSEGRPAATDYRVLETAGSRALLRLRLHTGRTHQIRVHLSAIGCPICGDFLYGRELAELPGRFALHSAFLHLRHPLTGEVLDLASPLPEEIRTLL